MKEPSRWLVSGGLAVVGLGALLALTTRGDAPPLPVELNPAIASVDLEVHPEIADGAFGVDPIAVDYLMAEHDMSADSAAEALRFQHHTALKVGDVLRQQLGERLIAVEVDVVNRVAVVYVSGVEPGLESAAQDLMGSFGTVVVSDGHPTVAEIESHWSDIEVSLSDAGIVAASAIGASELTIWADDLPKAKEIVSGMAIDGLTYEWAEINGEPSLFGRP